MQENLPKMGLYYYKTLSLKILFSSSFIVAFLCVYTEKIDFTDCYSIKPISPLLLLFWLLIFLFISTMILYQISNIISRFFAHMFDYHNIDSSFITSILPPLLTGIHTTSLSLSMYATTSSIGTLTV